jgi:hypothetical protein
MRSGTWPGTERERVLLRSQQSARRCHESEHGERYSSAHVRNMACARRSGSRYPCNVPVQLHLPPAGASCYGVGDGGAWQRLPARWQLQYALYTTRRQRTLHLWHDISARPSRPRAASLPSTPSSFSMSVCNCLASMGRGKTHSGRLAAGAGASAFT